MKKGLGGLPKPGAPSDLYAKVEGGVWSPGEQKAPGPDLHGWQRTQAEFLAGAFSSFLFL